MDFVWPPNIGLNNMRLVFLDHITQTQQKPTYIIHRTTIL